jgi:uncharacterized membrane protein
MFYIGEKMKSNCSIIILLFGMITCLLIGLLIGFTVGLIFSGNMLQKIVGSFNGEINIAFNETKLMDEFNKTILPQVLERQAYYYNLDNSSEIYSRVEGSGSEFARVE